MDVLGWCLSFLWDNFFNFMSFEIDLGSVSFTLWQFMLGALIVGGIAVFIVRRILE